MVRPGTGEWTQLDVQSIQHRDYFGHLSIIYSKITWLHLSSKMFIEHDDPLHMKPFLRMFNQGNSVAFDEEILFCVKSSQSEKGMKF